MLGRGVVEKTEKSVYKTTTFKEFVFLGDFSCSYRVLEVELPRPCFFPKERLVVFRYRVFGRHLVAHVGIEPRLEGMNLVSYHCSTSAI